MVSLRFPFPFANNPFRKPKIPNASNNFPLSAMAASATIGLGISLALYLKNTSTKYAQNQNLLGFSSPMFASLSFADLAAVEPKTGASFPSVLDGSKSLLGVGVRRKNLFGLKNIDVYAFGVYADENDVRKLSEKYSEPNENKDVITNILDEDVQMKVRLQIVYGRLSIRSVRSAFEESVGSRLKKFSGSDNKDLLQRFTSIFKDEYKIPRGSIIDLSKEPGSVLQTKIDGKEVGSIQSKLLCQSVFDLYIGEDPFDKRAKEDFDLGIASLLKK